MPAFTVEKTKNSVFPERKYRVWLNGHFQDLNREELSRLRSGIASALKNEKSKIDGGRSRQRRG